MIDPGSVGDWLQASLMAAALAGLAATGRWALGQEAADPDRLPAAPLRELARAPTAAP